jgi:hypothetical protein
MRDCVLVAAHLELSRRYVNFVVIFDLARSYRACSLYLALHIPPYISSAAQPLLRFSTPKQIETFTHGVVVRELSCDGCGLPLPCETESSNRGEEWQHPRPVIRCQTTRVTRRIRRIQGHSQPLGLLPTLHNPHTSSSSSSSRLMALRSPSMDSQWGSRLQTVTPDSLMLGTQVSLP